MAACPSRLAQYRIGDTFLGSYTPNALIDSLVRELAFDMILSRHNASHQVHDVLSSTLHSLPQLFLIRTSILQDSVFQKTMTPDQTISDCLWPWILASHWDVAFQRSNESSASIRCPKSWLDMIVFGDEGLRRARVVFSDQIWRRHSLLAIRILFELVDVLLIFYLYIGMALIPILKPTWPILPMAIVVMLIVLAANMISMLVYWAQHPIDLIYFPLYFILNLVRFCSQMAPMLRRRVQWRPIVKRDLVVDHHTKVEDMVEKQSPSCCFLVTMKGSRRPLLPNANITFQTMVKVILSYLCIMAH